MDRVFRKIGLSALALGHLFDEYAHGFTDEAWNLLGYGRYGKYTLAGNRGVVEADDVVALRELAHHSG